jgi:ribose-phosphate pyrophosphokinase
MIIFGGSASTKFAQRVSKSADAEYGLIDHRLFPDGEHYMRILSPVKGKDCAVIQTTKTNDAIVELLLLLDTLNDLGAESIHTVMPYMGYSRQDKVFNAGESFSAKTILKLLDQYSDSITTINCHFLDYAGVFDFASVKIRNLDAFPLVASFFKDKVKSPIIVSPDDGALEYAKKAAEIIGCEFVCLEKKRLSDHNVVVSAADLNVAGKDAIILDDMISTGGTIIEAARFLRKEGAKSVRAGCVHGVFSRGVDVFKGVVDELVCTDTIPGKVSKITVADLIAKDLPR